MWYNQVNGAIRVCLLCKYVTVHRPTHSKYQSSISWTEARRLSIFQKQLSCEYKGKDTSCFVFSFDYNESHDSWEGREGGEGETGIDRGTQRMFSVKYLNREGNIAYNFLLLEDGYKFLDARSINVQFSKLTFHSQVRLFS